MPLPERQLIERIRRATGPRSFIGDDCAVLRTPAGRELLVTTDFCLEGIHFRRDWHSAESAGHRCLARGLSDIAAMGGDPMAAFLSLALPAKLDQEWVDGFMTGFLKLARRNRVPLAGGDTGTSPAGVLADVIVLGSVPRDKALLRSAARPGQHLYVTGRLGDSARALSELRAGKRLAEKAANRRHFFPEPRIPVGRWLRERKLTAAMIDLSDGLSTDLSHLCEESGVGAVLDVAAIPVAKGATLEQALHGGEDYELLFTAPASAKLPRKIAGVAVTRIGAIRRDPKQMMLLRTPDGAEMPLPAKGWEHFR